jgi:hypothetical protein
LKTSNGFLPLISGDGDLKYFAQFPSIPDLAGAIDPNQSQAVPPPSVNPPSMLLKLVDGQGRNPQTHGAIQWSGYLTPQLQSDGTLNNQIEIDDLNADLPHKLVHGRMLLDLRGAVVDPKSANPVGYITLAGNVDLCPVSIAPEFSSNEVAAALKALIEWGCPVVDGKFHVRSKDIVVKGDITPSMYAALSGNSADATYWSSIQSCSVITPAQLQTQVQNASSTNNLFKLSDTERQRLSQH